MLTSKYFTEERMFEQFLLLYHLDKKNHQPELEYSFFWHDKAILIITLKVPNLKLVKAANEKRKLTF